MRRPRVRLTFLLLSLLVGAAVGAVVGGRLANRDQGGRAVSAHRSDTPEPSPAPPVASASSTTPATPTGTTPARRTSRAGHVVPPRFRASCPANPLRGVYEPSRLEVLSECRAVRGVVLLVRAEDDGDHHVNLVLAPRFERYLNRGDRTSQAGTLVTEIMPGQDLPIPRVGERMLMVGTWVLDRTHGWNEIHPIWAVEYLERGRRVVALPPVVPRFDPNEPSPTPTQRGTGGTNCTPGYSPCLLPAPDYDCAGGAGDGPKYVTGPVRVTGSDPYGLDSDLDGVGCES